MAVEAGAIVAEIGIAIVERAAPSGIKLIRSWIRGKKIVVVGQDRAGKTTFIDYLHYGIFGAERDVPKTTRVEGTARFDVKVGRNAALELRVKTVVEVPGPVNAVAHANIVLQQRPHAIIIFTDLTTPAEGESNRASGAWLEEFCKRLEELWRAKGRRGNRTRAIIVVMNKRDKVEDPQVLDDRRTRFRKILEAELHGARGRMIDEVAIMPCTLVSNPNGTREVDRVIEHLARALVQGQ